MKGLFAVAGVIGALIAAAGVLIGWWWLTAPVGLVLGLALPGKRGLPAALIAGAAGWGLGLLWVAARNPIVPTASAITAVMGLGSSAAVSLLLTLVIGALLALAPAWLGSSVRRAAQLTTG